LNYLPNLESCGRESGYDRLHPGPHPGSDRLFEILKAVTALLPRIVDVCTRHDLDDFAHVKSPLHKSA
jgi:hypothetical protein